MKTRAGSRGTMATVRASITAVLLWTVVVGLIFPAVVWGIGRLNSDAAEGTPVHTANGCLVGYKYLSIVAPSDDDDDSLEARAKAPSAPVIPDGMTADPWFHYRPYDPTNVGPGNPEQAEVVTMRRDAIAEREGVDPASIPADAVTSGFSGVESFISPEYAKLQIPRVAKANGVSEEEIAKLVSDNTQERTLGVLGAARVNATTLNAQLPTALTLCEQSQK